MNTSMLLVSARGKRDPHSSENSDPENVMCCEVARHIFGCAMCLLGLGCLSLGLREGAKCFVASWMGEPIPSLCLRSGASLSGS